MQQTPSNLWHEYFYVFIQSFFERVAAGLGQFWHTNHFLVCLRSVNLSVKHYKHEHMNFGIHFYQWSSSSCPGSVCHVTGETGFTRPGLITLQCCKWYTCLITYVLGCCVWCLAPFQSGRSCLDVLSSICSCVIKQQTWLFSGIVFKKVDLTETQQEKCSGVGNASYSH